MEERREDSLAADGHVFHQRYNETLARKLPTLVRSTLLPKRNFTRSNPTRFFAALMLHLGKLRMHQKSKQAILHLIAFPILVWGFELMACSQTIPSPNSNRFGETIQPLLREYCQRCHNEDKAKSGIRVDHLTADFPDNQLFAWKDVLKQIVEETMPPEGEKELEIGQRRIIAEAIRKEMEEAMARNQQKNGSIRRLTVSQYRNTLRELLGIEENVSEILPPDGISKDGFANNGQVMGLTPLQLEYYFEIADKALDLCIVDEKAKPIVQNFRVDLGTKINSDPCPDKLILGADSHLLNNEDFAVSELSPLKAFEYSPFRMKTELEFIEGYAGNDTVRSWRKFESIYHSVFACMRGSHGYPKGSAYEIVPSGLLLRPAIPSSEIFGQSSTYGPRANFKVSIRELPDKGNFRVKVKAARFADALLLDDNVATVNEDSDSIVVLPTELNETGEAAIPLPHAGIYQLDLHYGLGKSGSDDRVVEGTYEKPKEPKSETLKVVLNDGSYVRQVLWNRKQANAGKKGDATGLSIAFMQIRLPEGACKMQVKLESKLSIERIVLTKISAESDAGKRFAIYEKRVPWLGVHMGLRRDCGSTLIQVSEPQPVSTDEVKEFVFEGAINNFPSPFVERDNVNYLAGIREIGVRHEYTDGRDMPRLLIQSVEFEGPLLTEWPPISHRRIFIESSNRSNAPLYAQEIFRDFVTRAYRRPATEAEVSMIEKVWKSSYAERNDFQSSIKDALLVVLTSPQFLFLIEKSDTPDPEDLEPYELASKLSYFLWNGPPDARLLDAAKRDRLYQNLDSEIDRMILDPKFRHFLQNFASQWLSLDKFDFLEIDDKKYPRLTRDVRMQLRTEPVHFLHHLIEKNLPLSNIIRSDFILANDIVASYYGLGDKTENGLGFSPLRHGSPNLGGFLAQSSLLAGLSDGRESNPVKRGAWFARKMIAEPPDDPPPNVPDLNKEDHLDLSLRKRIELHRTQDGCAKCHLGIDPWGIPFEGFDASGIWKKEPTETESKLPDGTEIKDFESFRDYLFEKKMERVAFSYLKHVAIYATGRSLSYNEMALLEGEALRLKTGEPRMQDLIRQVIKSELFLKK